MLQKNFVRKISLVFTVCYFMLNMTLSAGAAALVWSGGGADVLASNPDNWSGSVSPQSGDAAIYDSTSSKNCTWDLGIVLSSFNLNPGYSGTVTIDAGLTIGNGFTWSGGGGDNLASNPANWSGGAVPLDGDSIDFEGMKDCLWDLYISPAHISMAPGFTGTIILMTDLSITGDLIIEGGLLDLNDNVLEAGGDLFIGLNGTLYGASSIIRVKGDWLNKGAFIAGTSTVMLNGTNQTVYGDNTFYNLVKTTDYADTLSFEAGKIQTVLNNLTLKGTAGNLLLLRSTAGGTFWSIDARSTRNVSHADIRDMINSNPAGITADSSHNSGNNSNVYFDTDRCL